MKLAFCTDEHYPYQDNRARSVALKIVSDFDPDLLIVGSDGLDFYAISSFDKNPERVANGGLQKEIDEWQKGQREWKDAAVHAERRWLPGNHEDRLRKYLWRHQELADLNALEIDNLLGFIGLGLTWDKHQYVSAEINLHNRLVVRHGRYIRKQPGSSVKAELDSEMTSISVLTGHSHRGGSVFFKTRKGVVMGYEGFCLCRLDPEWVANPNWQQGIVLANVTTQFLSIEPVLINDNRGKKMAIWREKQYLS